jgi:hypothetical protein
MAKVYTGRDGRLLLGTTDQRTLVKVTNWTLQADLETLETTTLGDSHRTYVPGILSYSGNASLLYYKEDNNNNDAGTLLRSLINTQTGGVEDAGTVTFTFRLVDGTTNSDVALTSYITSVNFGASVGEIVSAQVNFQGVGRPTTVTI